MSRYAIDVLDETSNLSEKEIQLVTDVLETALEMESIRDESEVSITFVTDEAIRELNKKYRDIDKPTDVLSFALNDNEEIPLNKEIPNLLGDIVVSVPRANEQALEYGHNFERELCFLAIHGFLHLLGYNHHSNEHETAMFNRQEDILKKHGLKK